MIDVCIIGAGAAGLFAAGALSEKGKSVLVLEHKQSAGNKLLITGKGRCNLINNCTALEFMQNVKTNARFLYSALNLCPPEFIMHVFENELNVPLKTERGRRVFPKSDNAKQVLNALLTYAQDAQINYNAKAEKLLIENGKVIGVELSDKKQIMAKNVLIATGGISYPVTGSTGDGYKLAKQAGHTIITPEPSLVSLVEKGSTCKKLMGLTLKNVELSLLENGKVIYKEMGEMLFTHFGVSGPLVLSASAHIKDIKKYNYSLNIDLKPALSEEVLNKRILKDFELLANKDVSNCLVKLLAASMQEVVLEKWGVDTSKKTNQITKQERAKLAQLLKKFTIDIKQKGDLEHAVITSGGVNVKEVSPKTMQSKLCKGLYFAGEVLDLDAYTGGYNLGIAFSSAYTVAQNI